MDFIRDWAAASSASISQILAVVFTSRRYTFSPDGPSPLGNLILRVFFLDPPLFILLPAQISLHKILTSLPRFQLLFSALTCNLLSTGYTYLLFLLNVDFSKIFSFSLLLLDDFQEQKAMLIMISLKFLFLHLDLSLVNGMQLYFYSFKKLIWEFYLLMSLSIIITIMTYLEWFL